MGGVSFFGLFPYQPPRYLYFAIFPLVYCTVLVAKEVVGERHWRLAGLYLLGLHAAFQFPGYESWLRRDTLYSYRDTAHDVVSKMEFEEDGPTVLMGGTASFVGLFEPRIRPVGFYWGDAFSARMAHWRPRYVLVLAKDVPRVRSEALDVVASYEVLGSYALLNNYYTGEDHVLIEVTYH